MDKERTILTIKSIVAVRARKIFNLLYYFWKNNPKVIGTILYESHLFSVLEIAFTKYLPLFSRSLPLPKNYGIGLSDRAVELPWFISQIPSSKGKLLDAGSSLNFYNLLFLKKFDNKDIVIANLNPERNCYWIKSISYLFTDLREKTFSDDYFDFIDCISVLEHVGLDNIGYTHSEKYREHMLEDYLKVIREFKRILRKGGTCYISIPFGKRKYLKWFQVFDRKMINNIVTAFRPSSSKITFYKYDFDGWQISEENACIDCEYSKGYPGKDYCVGSHSVACIKLTK